MGNDITLLVYLCFRDSPNCGLTSLVPQFRDLMLNERILLQCQKLGLVRESNPGPLAPEARIIPLDQQAI